ncbi:hypothetical protein DOTSEDRAFT_161770 [Dothistroma septosporum NZE10]|uniref:Heterokaryon incompatibility domain-containing protein n=1 Tax=Dothistroma septosporum (strain NZE10 / CBS 128990) TaxID=675120 RepID=N1PXR1_DOTSN|nr:hypothetical protein DOTSEDRAFT_161770 [Dothistroma septosporum NZE10]
MEDIVLADRPASRVWVMQEATLATKATCMIGTETVPLVKILRACMWLQYKGPFVTLDVLSSRGWQVCTHLWDYADHEYGYYGANANRPGSEIACALGLARRLDCSKPVDKVFGTLGLMKCTRAVKYLPADLMPDYEKPVAIVYRDATIYALQEDGVGEVFRYIKPTSREELEDGIWPSWVPRWDKPWGTDEPHDFMSTFCPDGDVMRRRLTRPEPDKSPDILRVRGIRVDTIEKCSASLPSLHLIFPAILIRWIQDAIRMNAVKNVSLSLQSHDTHTGAGRARDAAYQTSFDSDFQCTLIAGRNRLSQRPSDHDLDGLNQYVSYLTKLRDFPPDVEDLLPDASDHEQRASQYEALFRKACEGRRFIVTAEGRIGIAPGLAEEGDIVVVLWGGGTPFVLRPRADGMFLILGQCYVHGIMDEEAVKEWKEKGGRDEVFRLC